MSVDSSAAYDGGPGWSPIPVTGVWSTIATSPLPSPLRYVPSPHFDTCVTRRRPGRCPPLNVKRAHPLGARDEDQFLSHESACLAHKRSSNLIQIYSWVLAAGYQPRPQVVDRGTTARYGGQLRYI